MSTHPQQPDLGALTDQQLNTVFVVEVEGWTNVHPYFRIRTHDRISILKGNHPVSGSHCTVPDYTADANAVLPWLEKWKVVKWEYVKPANLTAHRIDLFAGLDSPEPDGWGMAPTFTRAAMIALILAKRAQKGNAPCF